MLNYLLLKLYNKSTYNNTINFNTYKTFSSKSKQFYEVKAIFRYENNN